MAAGTRTDSTAYTAHATQKGSGAHGAAGLHGCLEACWVLQPLSFTDEQTGSQGLPGTRS